MDTGFENINSIEEIQDDDIVTGESLGIDSQLLEKFYDTKKHLKVLEMYCYGWSLKGNNFEFTHFPIMRTIVIKEIMKSMNSIVSPIYINSTMNRDEWNFLLLEKYYEIRDFLFNESSLEDEHFEITINMIDHVLRLWSFVVVDGKARAGLLQLGSGLFVKEDNISDKPKKRRFN